MPLMKSKSKEAFSSNVRSEMDAGKPQKQALAIAYNIRRKQGKANGGMVNEKLEPGHEPDKSHFQALVHAILSKKDDYAGGGEVEETDYSESEDPLFTQDPDMEPAMMACGGEAYADGGEVEDPSMMKKKRLSGIMDKIRMKHMGK